MNNFLRSMFFVDGQKTLLFKFILSILVFLFARFVILIFKKIIRKMIEKQSLNNSKKLNSVVSISSSVFKYIVYFIAIILSLGIFGINTSSLVATAGVGGIVIAFGVQSIVRDLFNGVFILIDDQYNVGDDVIINGVSGEISAINMRNTVLKGYDGSINTISNGTINTVVNLSKDNQRRIVDFYFPTSVDLEKIKVIIEKFSREFEKNNPSITKTPAYFGISEIGTYYIKISITIWSKHSTQWTNEKIYREELLAKFKKENIEFLEFQNGDKNV